MACSFSSTVNSEDTNSEAADIAAIIAMITIITTTFLFIFTSDFAASDFAV
jgi:hypothetical protein